MNIGIKESTILETNDGTHRQRRAQGFSNKFSSGRIFGNEEGFEKKTIIDTDEMIQEKTKVLGFDKKVKLADVNNKTDDSLIPGQLLVHEEKKTINRDNIPIEGIYNTTKDSLLKSTLFQHKSKVLAENQ